MKVLLINTFETRGGAAIASKRLLTALNKTSQVSAKLLVNERQTTDENICETADSGFKKLIRKWRFYFEKILFIPFEASGKERFAFSTAYFGSDISSHPLVKDAEILHFHWTHQSFLSFRNLRQLIDLKKPVVVTMHDMWYFTGGCHHARECAHYMQECGNCMFLKNPHDRDLSYKIRKKKSAVYSGNMTFVGCSSWLADSARKSSLLNGFPVLSIPNPIDTTVFRSKDKTAARKALNVPQDKFLILFSAARVDDERKGYKYLAAALEQIAGSGSLNKDIELIIMGNVKGEVSFNYPAHFLGSLSDTETIISCYNAADILVYPSLEDNLPNTIVESMACGTPVVAFNVGGIPDIIDHKVNGYLADFKNTQDLVAGIEWVVAQERIAEKCIEKAESTFSEKAVTAKFTDLYHSVLKG